MLNLEVFSRKSSQILYKILRRLKGNIGMADMQQDRDGLVMTAMELFIVVLQELHCVIITVNIVVNNVVLVKQQ